MGGGEEGLLEDVRGSEEGTQAVLEGQSTHLHDLLHYLHYSHTAMSHS